MRPIDVDALSEKFIKECAEECAICPMCDGRQYNNPKLLHCKIIIDAPIIDRPQEWIPCSERLPDDDDRVLTYDTDGDINIMWFDGRDEDGKDVWKDDYSIEWCDIVAWQPLPEPWEGADDEHDK